MARPVHTPDRAAVLRFVRWVVGLAMLWSLVVVLGMAFWGGEALFARLAAIGPGLAAATLAAFAANHLLRFARWHLMLRAEGHEVPARRGLAIFLAGLALLPTPAKAGVAARSLLLLDEGVPVHVSLAAYFAERLTDLLGLAILAGLLLASMVEGNVWALMLAIGLVGVVLVRTAPATCRLAAPRVARWPVVARALDWLARFFDDAARMLAGWRLPAFVLLGLMANAVTGVLLWFALLDSGTPVDATFATGVLAVSHLSGSISMLPGGLGGFELAMLAQLSAVGVEPAAALVGVALVRIVTLWGSVLVGLALLYGLMHRGSPASPAAGNAIP